MRLRSTKSSSGSSPRRKRYVEFRPFQPEDLKWIGAAWAKGALDDYDEIFRQEMSPQEFKETFIRHFEENFNAGWTFFAGTEDIKPIGFAVAWMRGRVMEMGAFEWFPWASPRNILESSANFLDLTRKSVWDMERDVGDPLRYFTVLQFAHMKDNKFYTSLCKRGILRRVGHLTDFYPEAPCVLFQTKSPLR